jgi:outer membrane protein assembly factor BamB
MKRILIATSLVLVLALSARAENWPVFRGPTGQGLSSEKGLPLTWGPGRNVAWKADVPGAGWSSPIVWGNSVFVTTATEGGTSCHVLALARDDGRLLWDVEVFRQERTNKQDKNSYATPTPVTDGERVYAVFSEGGIAAVTVGGKPAWVNREVKHYSQHGLGASPVLYRDLLIMPFDGSSEGPDKALGWQKPWDRSFLLALDRRTGKERWRARRGLSRIAHTTPVVVHVGGRDELVSSAGDVIQGFDPGTGKRLWSVPATGEGVVPSPVFGDGLVFAASGFGNPTLRAVRVDGEGGPRVVWASKRNVPMIPSPLCAGGYLYTVTEKGVASCLEAATGKVKWSERLGGSFSASPVYAGGHVYFLSESAETTVVKTGPRCEVVARNALNEPCQASPAVSHGHLFLRTRDHLYCIGPR